MIINAGVGGSGGGSAKSSYVFINLGTGYTESVDLYKDFEMLKSVILDDAGRAVVEVEPMHVYYTSYTKDSQVYYTNPITVGAGEFVDLLVNDMILRDSVKGADWYNPLMTDQAIYEKVKEQFDFDGVLYRNGVFKTDRLSNWMFVSASVSPNGVVINSDSIKTVFGKNGEASSYTQTGVSQSAELLDLSKFDVVNVSGNYYTYWFNQQTNNDGWCEVSLQIVDSNGGLLKSGATQTDPNLRRDTDYTKNFNISIDLTTIEKEKLKNCRVRLYLKSYLRGGMEAYIRSITVS